MPIHVFRSVPTHGHVVDNMLVVAMAATMLASLAAMLWLTRAETRRAAASRELRRMQTDLANVGYSFLFGSPVILSFVALIVYRQGSAVVPGLLTGGAASLAYTLGLPWRLARTGDGPGQPGPAQRLLHQQIVRLRKPWLMILATAPFFAGVVCYLRLTGQHLPTPSVPNLLLGTLVGMAQVGLLAWGVQDVQVLRALRRETVVG